VLFGVSFRGAYSPTGIPGDTAWLAFPPTGWGWLGVLSQAPPGVKWCSYSARGGGATAVNLCCLSPPGVAQLLDHKGNDPRTALANYIDLRAPHSAEAWWLCVLHYAARTTPLGRPGRRWGSARCG